jgi:hypothetical protein
VSGPLPLSTFSAITACPPCTVHVVCEVHGRSMRGREEAYEWKDVIERCTYEQVAETFGRAQILRSCVWRPPESIVEFLLSAELVRSVLSEQLLLHVGDQSTCQETVQCLQIHTCHSGRRGGCSCPPGTNPPRLSGMGSAFVSNHGELAYVLTLTLHHTQSPPSAAS